MTTAETSSGRDRNWSDLAAGMLLVAGFGLAGVGSYLHLTITARVRAGQCDGCAPWHPLLVVTPMLVGSAFVLVGGYLLYRR